MTVVKIGQPEPEPRRSLLRRRVTPGLALLVIGAVVILRLWVVETAIVDGPSMQPTLRTGDRVLILKFLSPERYDIVVLKDPESGGTDIKRIVGLPGETVSMVPQLVSIGSREALIGSQLYIDREPYEEPYADSVMPAGLPPVKIPKGSYFAMGDNRDDSTDSRRYGPVPGGSMRGVGVAVIFPLGRMRVLPRGPEAAAPAGTVP